MREWAFAKGVILSKRRMKPMILRNENHPLAMISSSRKRQDSECPFTLVQRDSQG
jgi:hypothetical protein